MRKKKNHIPSYKPPKRRPGETGAEKIDEAKTLWKKPRPESVFALAHNVFANTGNEILASALRDLAKAEANSDHLSDADPVRELMSKSEVIEWLSIMREDVTWLIGHIEEHLDLQEDIPRLLPPDMRMRCEYCDSWFVPQRSTAKYCRNACRQAAYRERMR